VETSGTQDTEVRQTKNNRQSRDSGNIRNTIHRGKTKSTTDNLETLETSGTQDTEGRQNIGQSRDTGNIRNTGHRCMKIKAQRTI
jgi:hypothetical protein